MNPISIKKIAGESSEDDAINKKILRVYQSKNFYDSYGIQQKNMAVSAKIIVH